MKTVSLHGAKAAGRVALVDDEDYGLVMQYRWRVWEFPERNQGPYAQAVVGTGRGAPNAYMHKLITGWPMTDHEDHDGLNNQRCNLRPATHGQNRANQLPIRRRISEFKGVTPRYGRWAAQLGNGRHVSLGVYDTEIAAALAYDAGARHYFGEFACLNFPDSAASPLPQIAPPRLCVICQGFIDPIDFCAKCSDLDQKCDVHPRPRRRVNAVTCGITRCRNALRYAGKTGRRGAS